MMRFLLFVSVVSVPVALNADEPAGVKPAPVHDSAALQAYRERRQTRKAEALAQRARNNARKPPAVYRGRSLSPTAAGLAKPMEMVYSISQGRMVPARYQRVAVPTGFAGGYNVTVAPIGPQNPVSTSNSPGMAYQRGDRFKRNADGTITVYRGGVAIGKIKNGQFAAGKR